MLLLQYKHIPDMVFIVSFCILCLAIVVICIAKRNGHYVVRSQHDVLEYVV